jgi:hypothetical protein
MGCGSCQGQSRNHGASVEQPPLYVQQAEIHKQKGRPGKKPKDLEQAVREGEEMPIGEKVWQKLRLQEPICER